jgi:pimeloyl-ACP methyl ester carboxylesterase
VSALVLVDAVPLDTDAYLAGNARFNAHIEELQRQGVIAARLPSNDGDSCTPPFRAVGPAYLYDPHRHVDIDLGACSVRIGAATRKQVLGDSLDGRAEALASFHGRALVVFGEADAFGLAWLDREVELLSGARVERAVILRAGHHVLAEQPRALLTRISAFLDDRPS